MYTVPGGSILLTIDIGPTTSSSRACPIDPMDCVCESGRVSECVWECVWVSVCESECVRVCVSVSVACAIQLHHSVVVHTHLSAREHHV